MGLFKKSNILTNITLKDECLYLILLTDASGKNYKYLSIERKNEYNGYNDRLTTIKSVEIKDIVSISLEKPKVGPYKLKVVTKDRDEDWMQIKVSYLKNDESRAKEIVKEIQKIIN